MLVRAADATPHWVGANRCRALPMQPSPEWKHVEEPMKQQRQRREQGLEEGAGCCVLAEWRAAAEVAVPAHPVAAAARTDCSCVVLVELNAETPRRTRFHTRSRLRSEELVGRWWHWLARMAPQQRACGWGALRQQTGRLRLQCRSLHPELLQSLQLLQLQQNSTRLTRQERHHWRGCGCSSGRDASGCGRTLRLQSLRPSSPSAAAACTLRRRHRVHWPDQRWRLHTGPIQRNSDRCTMP